MIDSASLINARLRLTKVVKPRDLVIIKLHFGISIKPKEWQDSEFKSLTGIAWKDIPKDKQSLTSIGNYIGLSTERIRIIKIRSLVKLRNTPEFKHLQIDSIKHYNKTCKPKKPKPIANCLKSKTLSDCAIELDKITNSYGICDEILIVSILTLIYYQLNTQKIFDIPQMAPIDCVISSLKTKGYNLERTATFTKSVNLIGLFRYQYIANSILPSTQYNNFLMAYSYLSQHPQILTQLLT
jgi:hypothetical protein